MKRSGVKAGVRTALRGRHVAHAIFVLLNKRQPSSWLEYQLEAIIAPKTMSKKPRTTGECRDSALR